MQSEKAAYLMGLSSGELKFKSTWGTGFRIPQIVADNPATLPNPEFKLGVHGGLGGAPAFLGIALAPAPAGSVVQGANQNIELTGATMILPFILAGSGVGEGHATWRFALPSVPSARGIQVFAQWFVYDAGGPSGVASSRGARLTLR